MWSVWTTKFGPVYAQDDLYLEFLGILIGIYGVADCLVRTQGYVQSYQGYASNKYGLVLRGYFVFVYIMESLDIYCVSKY